MRRTQQTLASLNCHTLDVGSTAPRALVVVCHGYGAPGDDLVALAERLVPPSLGDGGVRFIFPQGPLSLAGMGMANSRAWWHLDVDMLEQRARNPSAFAATMREHVWEGLPSARKMLRQLVATALTDANLDYNRLILGGFSQGAMLTTDLALRLDEPPAGLVVLSGTLVSESAWRPLMAKRSGLAVVQSHGRTDPILPYANAEALRDAFVDAGCKVQFDAFAGGHTITPGGLRLAAELIETVARIAP